MAEHWFIENLKTIGNLKLNELKKNSIVAVRMIPMMERGRSILTQDNAW